jgi:hypothetical protein
MEPEADFASFMRNRVLPHYAAHPDYSRLDEQPLRGSDGSVTVFGKFRFKERVWIVHEDTRFEPLVIAFEAVKGDEEPFAEGGTKNGKKLLLRPDLKKFEKRLFLRVLDRSGKVSSIVLSPASRRCDKRKELTTKTKNVQLITGANSEQRLTED